MRAIPSTCVLPVYLQLLKGRQSLEGPPRYVGEVVITQESVVYFGVAGGETAVRYIGESLFAAYFRLWRSPRHFELLNPRTT